MFSSACDRYTFLKERFAPEILHKRLSAHHGAVTVFKSKKCSKCSVQWPALLNTYWYSNPEQVTEGDHVTCLALQPALSTVSRTFHTRVLNSEIGQMDSDSLNQCPAETLTAERDVLYSLLRGQFQCPSPNNEEIKSSISKTETDIRWCNEEIQRLQAQIIVLENKRRLLERNAAGYKSLLAPIRKLPPELLHQIFLFVCNDNYMGLGCFRFPAATLVQVCLSWNNVASSSPRLWSIITLLIPKASPEIETVLRYLLKKSGSAPLDVKIMSFHSFQSDLQWLDMLVRQSCRWMRLDLSLDRTLFDDVYNALRPIQGNLPLLEYLKFDGGPRSEEVLDIFQDAPRLRSVSLGYVSNPDAILLPWEQLQSLVLSSSRNRYAPLRRLSSKMKTITFVSRSEYELDPERSLQVVLDAEALSLDTYDQWDIIANLTLPKLTSLCLLSVGMETSIPQLSLIQSLISRSSCTLTSLRWSSLPIPLEPFLSFLSTVPSLTSLSLSDESTKDPFIVQGLIDKFRIRSSSIDIFLPNLQTLSLSSKNGEPCFSDASFVDAVTSRWLLNGGIVQCLRSVRLETPTRRFTTDIIPLQQLAQAGMKIVVKDKAGIVLC